ncbi:Alpha/Beta hydrolase protein [Aspergillus unguis]
MAFPAPHIHPHKNTHIHTHTAILLHGRGSSGPEFADDFFSSMTSKGSNLTTCLPSWRWVFPTSKDRWTSAFREEMPAWFDAYSLSNIQEQQELQVEGLRESALHILVILEEEIRLLGGKASNVYLGGISQGMATVLWTVFCSRDRINQRLGGILGFCGWIPFANQAENLIQQFKGTSLGKGRMQCLISDFFLRTAGITGPRVKDAADNTSPLSLIPVLLGHGTDDAYVPVELGRQTVAILREVMEHVEWKEFTGAEAEGHWIKEPEGFDCILEFLESSHRSLDEYA